jgi:hypothetical protein
MYLVAPLDHFGLDHHLRSNGCVATFDFIFLNGHLINACTYSF